MMSLGESSFEKNCCWSITYRQPGRKSSSVSINQFYSRDWSTLDNNIQNYLINKNSLTEHYPSGSLISTMVSLISSG